MVNFLEVVGSAKFFLDGKIVDGHAFEVKTQDRVEDELMFRPEKIVGVQDSGDLGDNAPFVQEHSREQLFLHFNGIGEIIRHDNHLEQ